MNKKICYIPTGCSSFSRAPEITVVVPASRDSSCVDIILLCALMNAFSKIQPISSISLQADILIERYVVISLHAKIAASLGLSPQLQPSATEITECLVCNCRVKKVRRCIDHVTK